LGARKEVRNDVDALSGAVVISGLLGLALGVVLLVLVLGVPVLGVPVLGALR